MLQITAMAVKASRVLAGALAVGGTNPLAERAADRIDARPDEHYRRAALDRADAARAGETGDGREPPGKVAVMIGASSGIGRAVAQELSTARRGRGDRRALSRTR